MVACIIASFGDGELITTTRTMVKASKKGADILNPSSIAVHSLLIVIVFLWLAKVVTILPEPYLVSETVA